MKIQMLRSKLHRACITRADIKYEGSIGIDSELLEGVGLYPYEKVLVANINNGQRFETYTIVAPFGSRQIILNGAAARLGTAGDRIIVMSYAWIEESLVRDGKYQPRIIRLDEHNEPVDSLQPFPAAPETASVLDR